MRVLVCGSREWGDGPMVERVLNGLCCEAIASRRPGVPVETVPVMVVIEGGAKGADSLAAFWAARPANGVEHLAFPADWTKHGKGAGPIRNQQMLDEGKPDVVIAFKDGFKPDYDPGPGDPASRIPRMQPRGGTEDVVRRAKAAGIPVYIVSHG